MGVWRAAVLSIWNGRVGIGLGLGAAVVGVVVGAVSASDRGALIAAPAGIAVAVAGWRYALYPLVQATADVLVVRNPWRTYRIPWTEIRAVASGYSGLEITTRAGGVTAWAVQKSNMMRWLGRDTRSDRIASELIARLRLTDSTGSPFP